MNKNYITFSFKGGAADDVRRNRRVRAIALVLMGLDFTVEVKGDRVDARLQKYERPGHRRKSWTSSAACCTSPGRWTCS